MSVEVQDWLMQGDPVIRWQAMRDLLDRPEAEWQAERRQTLDEGWVSQMLGYQKPDGGWPSGRWTDTVWTLLVLMDCGIPADHEPARRAAAHFVERCDATEDWLLNRMDLCHLGFWIRIGSYFWGQDDRIASVVRTILKIQMADGGWNCRIRNYPQTVHSSFHTTFNILEGLIVAVQAGNLDREAFRASEARALEFMLAHRMYKSDKTGEIVSERFTHLSFPSHWHYTVLRGLDYMQNTPEINDSRLNDSLAWLESRRKSNGRWPVEKRIPGTALVEMEKLGGDSRWNTLRALRVLKSRELAVVN